MVTLEYWPLWIRPPWLREIRSSSTALAAGPSPSPILESAQICVKITKVLVSTTAYRAL